jgi:hypothetical protein
MLWLFAHASSHERAGVNGEVKGAGAVNLSTKFQQTLGCRINLVESLTEIGQSLTAS